MSLSLIIPAIPEHVAHLEPLLEAFARGTERPDQVIVSLAQAPHVPAGDLAGLERFGGDRFTDFLLLRHEGRLLHGPNRQAGSAHVRHDLVMYQDADDLPHPQRVQVVKAFFAAYDIMHLSHSCFGMDTPAPDYASGTPPIRALAPEAVFRATFPTGRFEECVATQPYYGVCSNFHIHGGMPTVRREMLAKVRWKHPAEFALRRSEDYEFNMECLFHFRKTMLIDATLVRYRKYEEAMRYIAALHAGQAP